MSRIGKKPIKIPDAVTVTIDGSKVAVGGPKGGLEFTFHRRIHIEQTNGSVYVTVVNPEAKTDRALWGTSARILQNMIQGVTSGFIKKLEIKGIGYRAAVEGNVLILAIGFSHASRLPLPPGIQAVVEKGMVSIQGIDKQLVGEAAARLRRLRVPEPYKGTGIKYEDEIVRKKAGKQVKAAGIGAK